ncbi:hypothetical protein DICVIV_13026 [Dictyocaulus viviparus]|uniref:Uncharacterized protein n=1 Tax=Dictyocaulus viviparus TaxID=29172 RepID=A0A0D8XB64_DICVI|nr:hypothetical protein DICVIV_13026 [Dictyocaulus viviparus]
MLTGQHIGNNIIRGCFASVFKYGTTPRAQNSRILVKSTIRYNTKYAVLPYYFIIAKDTSCSRMPAHRLLPPHMAARSSNRSVDLCWCVGQLCNDYPSVPMNSVSWGSECSGEGVTSTRDAARNCGPSCSGPPNTPPGTGCCWKGPI